MTSCVPSLVLRLVALTPCYQFYKRVAGTQVMAHVLSVRQLYDHYCFVIADVVDRVGSVHCTSEREGLPRDQGVLRGTGQRTASIALTQARGIG